MTVAAILLGAVALLSPSPTVSSTPATDATVVAPGNWKPRPPLTNTGNFTFTNEWNLPVAGSSFTVAHEPKRMNSTLDSTARLFTSPAFTPGLTASHEESLCAGKLRGWYIESTTTLRGVSWTTEMVIATDNSRLYEVTYIRRSANKEDPDARKALNSFCV